MADVGVSGGRPGRSPLTLAILTAIGVHIAEEGGRDA